MHIENHGPLILRTDYWSLPQAQAGKMIISPNAGAIRCLMPRQLWPVLGELRAATHAVFTVRRASVEILWDDCSDAPHTWELSLNSCVPVPGDPSPGQWVISCWVERRGVPHRALEKPCLWRRGQ